jgi:hypothetical protein
MHDTSDDDSETHSDISKIVTGPIGSARLVEPAKAEPLSADLNKLRRIQIKPEPSTEPTETPPG